MLRVAEGEMADEPADTGWFWRVGAVVEGGLVGPKGTSWWHEEQGETWKLGAARQLTLSELRSA